MEKSRYEGKTTDEILGMMSRYYERKIQEEKNECPRCFQARDRCDCFLDDVANARELSYSWGCEY